MKPFLLILCAILFSNNIIAQTKQETHVVNAVKAVHKAVFETKDSISLEKFFAKQVTYGHSGLKLENRQQAIYNCSHNTSTYSNIEAKDFIVIVNDKTAVSRYVLTGTENTIDGKKVELKLHIIQTWVKEKKEWKMMARQAVKIG
jgi:hypothetical protein